MSTEQRKSRKRYPRAIEKAIYEKHNHRCAICGRPTNFDDGVLDHIIPLGRKGPDKATNLQWACYRCNSLKGYRRTNEEVREILGLPEDFEELVRLQDREKMITKPEKEYEVEHLPVLSQEGLDKLEIAKCIENLHESYQRETVIPEIFQTKAHEKWMPNFKFIGFDYRLPREWFLSDQLYSNLVMFGQFGRNIALGEQRYLQDQILSNKEIAYIKEDFSPEGILRAVKEMRDRGFKPDVVFTPVKHYMEMNRWKEKALVKYSTVTPRPRIDASLIIDGFSLKIVPSIGGMPLKDIILLSAKAIRWHVKRYPEYGALFITLGNDRLYPMKYAELIAGTTVNCEIKPKGVSILKLNLENLET